MTDTIDTIADDGWQDIKTNVGKKINWTETPNIEGVFTGKMETEPTTDGQVFEVLTFKVDGEDRFCWEVPELRTAFKRVPEGAEVQVAYQGQRQLDKVRSMGTFTVRIRPPNLPSWVEEPF